MYDRGTVVRRSRGKMGEGDDGLLRIADLELFRQGAKTELAADLGGLESMAVVGELQSVDFPLLVLHVLDRDATSVEFVEEHGVTRQAFPFVLLEQGVADVPNLLLRSFPCGTGLAFRCSRGDRTSLAMVSPYLWLSSSATLAARLLTKVVS